MVGNRAEGGVGWIRQRDEDGLVGLIQGVIDYLDGDVLVGHSRREGERAAGQGVVHSTACGRAARDRVIDRHSSSGECGERDGQIDIGH